MLAEIPSEGSVTLASGVGTISDTKAAFDSRLFLTMKTASGTLGVHYAYDIIPNVGFTVRAVDGSGSLVTGDTSTLSYVALNPRNGNDFSLSEAGVFHLLLAGDTGLLNERFAALVETAQSWDCPLILLGDNDYLTDANGVSSSHLALAPLSGLIAAEKVWPVWGNHDMNIEAGWNDQRAMFPYLTNPGKNYYTKVFGGGLIQIFFLNDGICARGMVEPDGNTVGSDQYNWFVAEAAASTAVWKFVAVHFPWVTASSQSSRTSSAIQWDYASHGIHAYFHGHAHLTELHRSRNLYTVNAGGAVAGYSDSFAPVPGVLYGDTTDSEYIFTEMQRGMCWRVECTTTKCRLILYDLLNKKDVFFFDIN